MHRSAKRVFGVVTAAVVLAGCGGDDDSDSETASVAAETLLDRQATTILDQALSYPTTGQAEVSASVLTLQPGASTGWHRHDAPLLAYILDGAIEVDYGPEGTRTYESGEVLMEAVGTVHNGATVGDDPVEIFVVNFGAAGTDDTVTGLDPP